MFDNQDKKPVATMAECTKTILRNNDLMMKKIDYYHVKMMELFGKINEQEQKEADKIKRP